MNFREKIKSIIEAILFAAGREVNIKELMSALELGSDEIFAIIDNMRIDYEERGIEIIKINDIWSPHPCTPPRPNRQKKKNPTAPI